MNPFRRYFLLNARNKGLLLDGKSGRLTEKVSCQSALILGGVGRGKTTRFVIPNLMTLDDCSMLITDTSGELYEQSSGHLADRGFDVKILNLMNPAAGEQYNTLDGIRDHQAISKKANLIITSADSNSKDRFWDNGASALLRVFIQSLVNYDDKTVLNLSNVNRLLARFAHPTTKPQVDHFVAQTCAESDPLTLEAYIRQTGGSANTVSAIATTAAVALKELDNMAIAKMTAQSTFDFHDMRRKKTAFFILVNQTDMADYAFLLNLFYT